jgi:calcium/calmodulin-dependent protein kinase I
LFQALSLFIKELTSAFYQNVLVVNGPPQWWVKLADFGLSKRLTDTTAFHTRNGSLPYMAPEILNYLPGGSTDYTNSVDMWSAGCITYRIICGSVPFPPGTSLMKYCEDKSLFPLDALFDSGVKSEGFKFIKRLLVTNPKERLSASEALKLSGSVQVRKVTDSLPFVSVYSLIYRI